MNCPVCDRPVRPLLVAGELVTVDPRPTPLTGTIRITSLDTHPPTGVEDQPGPGQWLRHTHPPAEHRTPT